MRSSHLAQMAQMGYLYIISILATSSILSTARSSSLSRRDDWSALVAKGEGYMNSLNRELQNPNHRDLPTCNFGTRGYALWPMNDAQFTSSMDGLTSIKTTGSSQTDKNLYQVVTQYLQLRPTGWFNQWAYNPPNSVQEAAPGQPPIRVDGTLQCTTSTEQGAVIVRTIDTRDAPTLRWSEYMVVTWQNIQQASTAAGLANSNSGLRWIVHTAIDNDYAVGLLDEIMVNFPDERSATFDSGWDEFYALLTTQNLVGIPYLLRDYRDTFGGKTIREITVYDANDPDDIWAKRDWYLVVELGNP